MECPAFQELDEELEKQIFNRWKDCKLDDIEGQKNVKMLFEGCKMWISYIKSFIIDGENAQDELSKQAGE